MIRIWRDALSQDDVAWCVLGGVERGGMGWGREGRMNPRTLSMSKLYFFPSFLIKFISSDVLDPKQEEDKLLYCSALDYCFSFIMKTLHLFYILFSFLQYTPGSV